MECQQNHEHGSTFHGPSSFNGNISEWNVSSVTNMVVVFKESSILVTVDDCGCEYDGSLSSPSVA